jgi:hypothetical protein
MIYLVAFNFMNYLNRIEFFAIKAAGPRNIPCRI